MSAVAIVLAAGKGTRMRSDVAKVLHLLWGKPLVVYPLIAAAQAGVCEAIVVVGHQADEVRQAVREHQHLYAQMEVCFAEQNEQRGTGHAVLCAMPQLHPHQSTAVILSGDVPRLGADTIKRLVTNCDESTAGCAVLTFFPKQLDGYGRIVRGDRGHAIAIREQRDASADELAITECNAGVYAFHLAHLRRFLPTLTSENAQGELYLTDLIAHLAPVGTIAAIQAPEWEVAGINTREQLDAMNREQLDVMNREQP